jgi:hypothetical protein
MNRETRKKLMQQSKYELVNLLSMSEKIISGYFKLVENYSRHCEKIKINLKGDARFTVTEKPKKR